MSALGDTVRLEQDAAALRLRSEGRSYGTIAKHLGMEKTWMAVAAFNRALRRQTPPEQDRLRQQESTRLSKMQLSVEENDELDGETRRRRLATLDRLREALFSTVDTPSTTEPVTGQ